MIINARRLMLLTKLLGKITVVLIFGIAMVVRPEVVFKAALRGLTTWWNIVFPALLPFFVVSELLMGFGVVHFLGVLLEPVMRPLFNVPGSGAFVVAVGYTSGAPIGAALTGQLRRQNFCTKTEASRLMGFTNNASPLFMFGAIAVGMFHAPKLGILIACSHYLANLCLGIALRFYAYKSKDISPACKTKTSILKSAVITLLDAYQKDGRPLGKLLGDAVRNSIQTLLTIGGFITIFSVIIEVLSVMGLMQQIALFLACLMKPFNLSEKLFVALSSGLLEMTIGVKLASEVHAPLEQQLIVTSMILGWLGLSVHAQAISLIADTDIDIKPYLFARVGHSLLAGFWTILLLKSGFHMQVFAPNVAAVYSSPWLGSILLLKVTFMILFFLIILSICINIAHKLPGKRLILFFTSLYK